MVFYTVFNVGLASVNTSIGGDLVRSCVGIFWEMCSHCLLGLGVGHSQWVGLQVCTIVGCGQMCRLGYSGMSGLVGVNLVVCSHVVKVAMVVGGIYLYIS